MATTSEAVVRWRPVVDAEGAVVRDELGNPKVRWLIGRFLPCRLRYAVAASAFNPLPFALPCSALPCDA